MVYFQPRKTGFFLSFFLCAAYGVRLFSLFRCELIIVLCVFLGFLAACGSKLNFPTVVEINVANGVSKLISVRKIVKYQMFL